MVLFVVDPDAAKVALRARMIGCPEENCSGRLQPWSSARPRTVTIGPGERVRLVPDRGVCKTCRTTHTLLPAWYVPRRSCGADFLGMVIGAVVNHGHRAHRIAVILRLARTTVRRWMHGLADADRVICRLTAHVTINLGGGGLPIRQRRPRLASTPATEAVALALDELAYAATAITRPALPNTTKAPSGVDYIYLLCRADRVEQNRRLRLVDPSDARPGLSLWAAINLAAGGRFLNMIASGSRKPRAATDLAQLASENADASLRHAHGSAEPTRRDHVVTLAGRVDPRSLQHRQRGHRPANRGTKQPKEAANRAVQHGHLECRVMPTLSGG